MVTCPKLWVNGIEQQLYLHLEARSKATVLFIHGGPGWSDAPWAGMTCQRLWGKVNTVHWDQRGCNKSQVTTSGPPSLTIEQMILDGIEVCRLLHRDFRIERPILVGHSWGAFLAVLMAARAPELFRSYIGIGQLVANRESDPLSLALCKRKAEKVGRADLLRELNLFSSDFYRSIERVFRQRVILAELGGEFFIPARQAQLEQWMQQSPESYRSDWTTLYSGCQRTCDDLWPELIDRSLVDEVTKMDIPVTLIHGVQDYCTPSAPALKWLNDISCAGSKEWVEFERSAHWPHLEQNERFARLILQRAD